MAQLKRVLVWNDASSTVGAKSKLHNRLCRKMDGIWAGVVRLYRVPAVNGSFKTG
jgi:hypothetical protein